MGAQNAIFVAIGSGIGAGLVVDGRLVRGAHAAAGEIRRLAERLRERWAGPSPLRIVPGALGPGAAARGVARLALSRVHEELCRSAERDGAASIVRPESSAIVPTQTVRATRAPKETRHA